MTLKQKVLKAFYPAFRWFSKSSKTKVLSNKNAAPIISFYTLKDTLINGQPFNFDVLKGKKILLVNTASDCGYTGQYEDLEKLSRQFQGKLVVIGFPSNDFGEQEKGDDNKIATFCKMNYGVNFSLMQKSIVIKKPGQNKIYQWLTEAAQNGWNNKQPEWNFSKYLLDENGKLVNYFAPAISPTDSVVLKAISE